mgnify:CR=1 FL=1
MAGPRKKNNLFLRLLLSVTFNLERRIETRKVSELVGAMVLPVKKEHVSKYLL